MNTYLFSDFNNFIRGHVYLFPFVSYNIYELIFSPFLAKLSVHGRHIPF